MKKLLKLVPIAVLTFIMSPLLLAQESPQLYHVHVDNVNPPMTPEYEKLAKEWNTMMAKYKIEVPSHVFINDENQFMSVSPIENMSDLDNDYMAVISEKGGGEEMSSLLNRFNKCYDSHQSNIIAYHDKLSYKYQRGENDNYYEWMYWTVKPENTAKASKILKEWKALYEETESEDNFGVFSNLLGENLNLYYIVSFAESQEAMAKAGKENREKFGEKGKKLWEQTQAITESIEVKTGWYMSDLSYSPPVPMAKDN